MASPALDPRLLLTLASKMNVPRERMPDELPDPPPAHTTPKPMVPVAAVVTTEEVGPTASAEADSAIPIAVTAVVTTGDDASAALLPASDGVDALAPPATGADGALQLQPPPMPIEAVATVDGVSDGVGADGQPKAKRLKRKEMAEMDEDSLSRRTWCLKCKQDGKSRWSWKGSRTDARNGLRHHMKMAHQLTMEQAKQKQWIEL